MTEIRRQIRVGMAEMEVSAAPGLLACIGIGSCVVVALYDPEAKIAGLAHTMLPQASKSDLAVLEGSGFAKYANTAPSALLQAMEALGAKRSRIVARLVGGATMFAFSAAKSGEEGASLGDRNADNARKGLESLGIALQAEDTGGNFGRSIELNAEDGSLQVRTAARGTRWL